MIPSFLDPRVWGLLLSLALSGCSSLCRNPDPIQPRIVEIDVAPDMSRVAVLVGADGIAHGCPIESETGDLLLTAKHVAVAGKDSPIAPRGPSIYPASVGTQTGSAKWMDHAIDVDLAAMRLDFKVTNPYRLSKTPAREGDKVWLVDFDRNKRRAFQPKVVESKVVTVLPGHYILSEHGLPGSSGSCVVNAAGEVVGINVAYLTLDDIGADVVGMVVAVMDDPKTAAKVN